MKQLKKFNLKLQAMDCCPNCINNIDGVGFGELSRLIYYLKIIFGVENVLCAYKFV